MIPALFSMVGYGPLRRVVSAGALIGVLLCGVISGGDSSDSGGASLGIAAARADLADQHYKRALTFYENKDYPRAIREFQAAYKVRQLPRILLNIGQVYRKLGMASTALKFYEHYLRVDLQPKPEIKLEVDRYIAQTRAMLDPPDIVPLPSKSAAAAAAAAVAEAPSNVTPITVPEYYTADEDLPYVPMGKAGKPLPGAATGRGKLTAPPLGSEPVTPPLGVAPTVRVGAIPFAVTPPPAGTLRSALVTPPPEPIHKPFYKKSWFWVVVGGVAASAVITGVAVGVAQKSTVPTTILYPTK